MENWAPPADLTRLLEATGRVDVGGGATDPEAALTFLHDHSVDVLFLDIQMPGMTGFELLEQLERPPLVVFTTAYDAYALSAFETNAIDYLLKPIEADRLDRALDKIARLMENPRAARADVRALARQLAAELAPKRLERIASRVGEKTTLLDVARNDIQNASGLELAEFEAFAKVVESRIGAPWKMKDGKTICEVVNGKAEYHLGSEDELRDAVDYPNEAAYLAARAA